MSRLIKLQMVFVLSVFALAACAPAAIVSSSGVQPTPIVETEKVMQAATAVPTAASVELPKLKVNDVQIQIGVGSPIPVDAFISAELPDICAQLAEVKATEKDFTFEIIVSVTPGTRADCIRDTLPFKLVIPLNMVSLPNGTYTVKVNDVHTMFQWPSQPTITPELASQTYHNTLAGFEFDYPLGWLLDNAGDVDTLWSERPTGVGKGGVPENVAKVDVISEIKGTMTLDELVARQKKDLTSDQIKSEQAIMLPSGLPAVRMEVAAFANSTSLLTIVNGHPVMIINYGDTSHFEEIANSLRVIQP